MAYQFLQANFWWIVFAKLFSIAAHVIRAARWNLLINSIGHRSSLINSFFAVMIGYLANMAVPRLGEVMRCWGLNKLEKIPANHLFGTVIIERAIDLLSLFILIMIAFTIKFQLLSDFFINILFKNVWQKLIFVRDFLDQNLILIFLFSLILFVVLLLVIKRILKNKLKKIYTGLLAGLRSILELQQRGLFTIYTILLWLLYFLGFYVCFFALTATNALSVIDSFLVFIISALGMAAPVQAGIGTFHWAVTTGLSLFGINELNGLVLATLIHTTGIVLILVLGGVALIITLFKTGHESATQK